MKISVEVIFSIGLKGFICLILCSSCTNGVTLKSLIKEMTDRETLTYFPQKEYTHHQFSSYNRASVSPDKPGWYENYDMSHFLRVEENSGRREFVIFDAEGPGAIVRWWMTFYKAQDGILRIYIDNDSTPVIVVTEKKPVRLLLAVTKAPDYGIWQAYLNGIKVGPPMDMYDEKVHEWEHHLLDFWPDTGNYTLELRLVGKNHFSTGNKLGIESLRIRERRPRVIGYAFDKDNDWKTNPKLYE